MNRLLLIALLALSSCYTQKTALKQVAKAHNKYPEIPAKFCAEVYDPKDSVHILKEYIQGEDVVFADTLIEVYNIHDTVTITKYLTRTVKTVDTVRDTKYIQTENKAALKLKELEIAKLQQQVTEQGVKLKEWKKYTYILGGILLAYLIFRIAKFYLTKK